MSIEVEKPFALTCYAYLGCLAVSLLWYRARQSRIPRFILGVLILLPAIFCMALGIGALSSGVLDASGSDEKALSVFIGIVMCLLGMTIAFFAVRLIIRPAKPQKKGGDATEPAASP
jgi:hypothetical protein